ncbi:2-octaprenyl-6-methoxyphenyl hydroxylase [Neptunicella sp.]|uniref:2-octaprenyl-6-methoxyphenyl hydroxylase n=1 Tax=Neptunicella sp. TaxID=2125986 RepID=UPI003F6912CC
MNPDLNTDIIIVGGGTIGCSLALALAQQTSLTIAIVEAKSYQANQPHPGFDARSLALAKRSQQVLDSWGLSITEIGTAIKQIKVTDQGHIGQCWLDCEQQGLDALGYVVELQQLGQQLHSALAKEDSAQLRWYCPDQIEAINQQQQHIQVRLTSQQTLTAKLLVIADGANSPSAKMIGVGYQQQDYQQVALIANVSISESHANQAFERFTASGPLALLPLEGQRCSLVWTLSPDDHQSMLRLNESQFLTALQKQFGYALGHFTQVSERHYFPLALVTAESSVRHRAVIVGNASQQLHPIAGQGFNLGLRDVEVLANLLGNAAQDQDIGSYGLLRDYQQSRIPDQQRVIGLTDGLVRLFSNHYFPMVMGRNIGLTAMNLLPAIKSQLATQAMGYGASSDSKIKGAG